MLNADMGVAYPVITDLPPATGQRQVCGPNAAAGAARGYGCRNPFLLTPPGTWDLCVQYSLDNNAFLQACALAYTKMTTVGYAIDVPSPAGKLGTLTSIDLTTACP